MGKGQEWRGHWEGECLAKWERDISGGCTGRGKVWLSGKGTGVEDALGVLNWEELFPLQFNYIPITSFPLSFDFIKDKLDLSSRNYAFPQMKHIDKEHEH